MESRGAVTDDPLGCEDAWRVAQGGDLTILVAGEANVNEPTRGFVYPMAGLGLPCVLIEPFVKGGRAFDVVVAAVLELAQVDVTKGDAPGPAGDKRRRIAKSQRLAEGNGARFDRRAIGA